MMEDLDSMKYTDLQKIAKRYGIKANQKGDKIIAALRELAGQQPISGELTTDSQKECTTTTDSEPEENITGRKSRKNRKGAKSRKKTKMSENVTSEDECARIPPKMTSRRSLSTPKAVKSYTPNTTKLSEPCSGNTPNISLQKSRSTPGTIPKVVTKSPISKGRTSSVTQTSQTSSVKSGTPKTSSGKKTKVTPRSAEGHTKVTPRSAKGHTKVTPRSAKGHTKVTPRSAKGHTKVTPRSAKGHTKVTPRSAKGHTKVTPRSAKGHSQSCSTLGNVQQIKSTRQSSNELMTDDEDQERKEIEDLMTDDEDDEITFHPKRRSRSNTFTQEASSPNVKDLLDSMRDDMTADQRKKSLMEALDRNVEKNSKASTSNIPRFTGLSRKSKEAADETKPRTPGRDWSKIHKRQWDKMDSLDEYLAKKRKRTETVSQSVKKLKLMTEQMKTNMQSRKQLKSPAQTIKTKTSLFQSPHPVVPFKPKVISTTKMNLNFANASNKEKIVMNSRTELSKRSKVTEPKPVKGGQALFTIGKATKGTSIPKRHSKENRQRQTSESRKSEGGAVKSDTAANTRMASPTTRRTSANNRTFTMTPAPNTINANKSMTTPSTKKFDIQASLTKQVNYKPHKGQLKPFSFGKLHNSETSFKEVKVKSRDDRRQENIQRRAEKKSNLQMSRRGISAL